jgi:stress response protein YsnF
VTERAEEAVVSKEARVVEEVVVNKEVEERTETVRDTVRRTDVDVREMEAKTDRRDR